jgi:formylglycine-generating enzyme required for sulfatase activity
MNDLLVSLVELDKDKRPNNAAEIYTDFRKARTQQVNDPNATSATLVESLVVKLRDELVPLKNRLEQLLLEYGEIPASAKIEIDALTAIADVDSDVIGELTQQIQKKHSAKIIPIRNFTKHLEVKVKDNPQGLSASELNALLAAGKAIGLTEQSVNQRLDALLPKNDNFKPTPQPTSVVPSSNTASATNTLSTQHSADEIGNVQRLLISLGYQVAVSGRLDVRTQQAIKEFEESSGLKSTGDIDPLLIEALTKAFNDADEKAWSNAKNSRSPEELQAYAKAWPHGRYVNQVESTEEDWAWAKARHDNTVKSYGVYSNNHPTGRYADDARNAQDEAAWLVATKVHTDRAYADYTKDYPRGLHSDEVEEAKDTAVWDKAKQSNTVDSYHAYVEQKPQGRYRDKAEQGIAAVTKAAASRKRNTKFALAAAVSATIGAGLWWQSGEDDRAWQQAKQRNSEQSYQQFVSNYSSSEYAITAQQRLDKIEENYWQNLQQQLLNDGQELSHNSNPELLNDYNKTYPNGRFTEQATSQLGQIETIKWRLAEDTKEPARKIELLDSYLAAYPQGRYAEKANNQLKNLDEEFWQKATKQNTVIAYEQYQALYPAGIYSREVSLKIANAEQLAQKRAAARVQALAYYQQAQLKAQTGQLDDVSDLRKQANKVDSLATTAKQWETLLIEALENKPPPKKIYKVGDKFVECDDCPEMIAVPAGEFMMGSNDYDDAKPIKKIKIAKPFAVGVYELKVKEFELFAKETNYKHDNTCNLYRYGITGADAKNYTNRQWSNPDFKQDGSHPVVCVNWDTAKRYVKWLSEKTNSEYRLLSESEWEYVARAGTATNYWWGDKLSKKHTRCDCEGLMAAAVGGRSESTKPAMSYKPNQFGLYNTTGNAREWVEDCHVGSYSNLHTDGRPTLTPNCSRRVARGGSWMTWKDDMKVARRHWSGYSREDNATGFRVARTLD